MSPLCVDSGRKRSNSSLTKQWVVLAGLCGPDRQGQLRARHPRAAGGSGFPPICCCVHGHLRQVIFLCLSSVFSLESGDIRMCGLQSPCRLKCALSPAPGSQAEAPVSPGDGLAPCRHGCCCLLPTPSSFSSQCSPPTHASSSSPSCEHSLPLNVVQLSCSSES